MAIGLYTPVAHGATAVKRLIRPQLSVCFNQVPRCCLVFIRQLITAACLAWSEWPCCDPCSLLLCQSVTIDCVDLTQPVCDRPSRSAAVSENCI